MRAEHLPFLGQIERRFFAQDHEKGQKSKGDPDSLRGRKDFRDGPTAGISAIKFDDKAGRRIKEEVIPEKLTLETFRPTHDDQSQENSESRGGFIKLGRMEGNSQRSQAVWVPECAGPRHLRG